MAATEDGEISGLRVDGDPVEGGRDAFVDSCQDQSSCRGYLAVKWHGVEARVK
ncbi:MAG: hypothetical protein PVG11_03515 [Anaerolineae bacterium]|jgi:hypothetical protein